ncbi:MAG: hypothetical protein M1830_003591 [Pleopsidium flavum]|nr:MAG: hypothetical protein M1830_003591 [Pleopsidium flavum]
MANDGLGGYVLSLRSIHWKGQAHPKNSRCAKRKKSFDLITPPSASLASPYSSSLGVSSLSSTSPSNLLPTRSRAVRMTETLQLQRLAYEGRDIGTGKGAVDEMPVTGHGESFGLLEIGEADPSKADSQRESLTQTEKISLTSLENQQ